MRMIALAGEYRFVTPFEIAMIAPGLLTKKPEVKAYRLEERKQQRMRHLHRPQHAGPVLPLFAIVLEY